MKHILTIFILSGACTAFSQNNFKTANTLYFIENKGQVTDQYCRSRNDIDFRLNDGGISVFAGEGQLHYQFLKHDLHDLKDRHEPIGVVGQRSFAYAQDDKMGYAMETYRMDVELVGSNRHATLVLEEKQSYYERYYTPAFGEEGGVAYSYKRATYKDIYPGIDWVLYIKDDKVEYEFVVNEGADASRIKIRYNGATGLKVNNDGSLTAVTPFGSVTEATPYSYTQDGKTIASSFVLDGDELSFNVAAHKGQLVIDPSLVWSTYYHGSSSVTGVEGIGSFNPSAIYLAGHAGATDIATTGAYQQVHAGGNFDAILAKFDSTGSRLWCTYYGGEGSDQANDIVCNENGSIYIAGNTTSATSIATTGVFQPMILSANLPDGFLAKFDSNGVRLWATYYGSQGSDAIIDIDVDYQGSIYACGYTTGPGFYVTNIAHQLIFGGGVGDGFIAKFDSLGFPVWSTYYGGNDFDQVYTIKADNGGYVYAAGETGSSNSMATLGSHQLNLAGMRDGFIVKLDAPGIMNWATYYGGDSSDCIADMCFDALGSILVAGASGMNEAASSPLGIATMNGFQPTSPGGSDAFVAKFNTSGMRLWGSYYGGPGNEGMPIKDVLVSDGGTHFYLAGITTSTTGIATGNVWQANYGGNPRDGFIYKLDDNGQVIWGSYFGSMQSDLLDGIHPDGLGNVYLTGETISDINIATPGAYQETNLINGQHQAFIARVFDCSVTGLAITQTGNTLGTGVYATYQRYLNGNPIPGATSQTYNATQGGIYTVLVTDGNGCSATSAGLTLGVENISTANVISIVPNPAAGLITINTVMNNATVTVTNVTGQVMMQYKVHNGNRYSIDISALASGVYMVEVNDDGVRVRGKVVKE